MNSHNENSKGKHQYMKDQNMYRISSQCYLQKMEREKNLSNAHRIGQQLKLLSNSEYSYRINAVSQNRVEIITKHQIINNKSGFYDESSLFYQQDSSQIEFVIILHELFPWTPPFVICATQVMFPRLDDYRDYLQDILNREWWPNITVISIIEKISDFIETKIDANSLNLNSISLESSSSKRNSFLLGNRVSSPSMMHSIDCIRQYCKGIRIFKAEYFNKEGVLMGKYQKILLGLSWNDIVLYKFANTGMERNKGSQMDIYCFYYKKWAVRNIRKIQSKKLISKHFSMKRSQIANSNANNQQKQTYQFCMHVNGKKQYVKIQVNMAKQIDELVSVRIENSGNRQSKQQFNLVQDQISKNCQFQNNLSFNKQNYGSLKILAMQQKQEEQNSSNVHIQIGKTQKSSNQESNQKHKKPMQRNKECIIECYQDSLQFFRHVIQYIQLRECVLAGNQCFETKIRMLSQVLENAADLADQFQLHRYYRGKLKQIISNQFVATEEETTTKFQFDI